MTKSFLTTKEVADILKCTTATVRNYEKRGLLTPIPDNPNFPMRRHKIYEPSEVHTLQEQLSTNGYTIREIAQKLNISANTVHNYIQEGKMKARLDSFLGRERYVVSKEDFEQFLVDYERPRKQKQTYYELKANLYLFQPYVQSGTQSLARITHLNTRLREARLFTDKQETLTLKEALANNYKPVQSIVSRAYSSKRGWITFQFPFLKEVHQRQYDLFDWLMKNVGYQNMRLVIHEEYIILKLRALTIPTINHRDFLSLLQKHVKEGGVREHPKGIQLLSDYEPLNVTVSREVKEFVEQQTSKKEMTQNEWMESVLRELMDQESNE